MPAEARGGARALGEPRASLQRSGHKISFPGAIRVQRRGEVPFWAAARGGRASARPCLDLPMTTPPWPRPWNTPCNSRLLIPQCQDARQIWQARSCRPRTHSGPQPNDSRLSCETGRGLTFRRSGSVEVNAKAHGATRRSDNPTRMERRMVPFTPEIPEGWPAQRNVIFFCEQRCRRWRQMQGRAAGGVSAAKRVAVLMRVEERGERRELHTAEVHARIGFFQWLQDGCNSRWNKIKSTIRLIDFAGVWNNFRNKIAGDSGTKSLAFSFFQR